MSLNTRVETLEREIKKLRTEIRALTQIVMDREQSFSPKVTRNSDNHDSRISALEDMVGMPKCDKLPFTVGKSRHGTPWSMSEDSWLMTNWRKRCEGTDSITVSALAQASGRTRGAIWSRLDHLGLL